MGCATVLFFAPAPGVGLKGQISLNFHYKSNFKDFYIILYQTGFSFCFLGHAQKVGLRGLEEVKKIKLLRGISK